VIVRPAAADDAQALLTFWLHYAEPSVTDTSETVAILVRHA
jgi:hypothetical protein